MKESLRRPILFVVIIITGSILILFDIPLIFMFPIILIVGFLILIILGAITVTDIKTGLKKLKPSNLKNIGIIKKLKGMKFSKKSASVPKDKTQPQKAGEKQPVKGTGKKKGIGLHISSFVSSIKSLGSVLKARGKSGKKVDDINKQLDRTVREKVEKSSALDNAGNVGNTSATFPSRGAVTTDIGTTKDQDPFLSLSEDEFDSGLLDSLDSLESSQSIQAIADGSPSSVPPTNPIEINEPDIPLPSLDLDGEAGNILMDNAEGLEEFSGLDGGDAIDSDFGDLDNLSPDDVEPEEDAGEKTKQSPATSAKSAQINSDIGDFDNISLDDVELEEDAEERTKQSSATSAKPAQINDVAPEKPGKDQVKSDWFKSDAQKEAGKSEEETSAQSDMAAFSSGGGGTDADLLSSLASEVRHVKKERNLSLLRDLADFKAPGEEIESELTDVFTRMKAIKETHKKKTSPTEGIK